jgi:Arc/MetJ family transcription regulator
MSVTQVDLDDEALNEAMRLLGTKTKKETINMALREVVQRTRRVEAAQKLFEMGQRGDFDEAAEAHAAAKRARKQVWAAVQAETEQ